MVLFLWRRRAKERCQKMNVRDGKMVFGSSRQPERTWKVRPKHYRPQGLCEGGAIHRSR